MSTPPEAESDMRDPGVSSAYVPGTSPVLGVDGEVAASAADEAEPNTSPAAAASSPARVSPTVRHLRRRKQKVPKSSRRRSRTAATHCP